jgi:hypothetical protein
MVQGEGEMTKRYWKMLYDAHKKLSLVLAQHEAELGYTCEQYHCGHPVCNKRRKKEAGRSSEPEAKL